MRIDFEPFIMLKHVCFSCKMALELKTNEISFFKTLNPTSGTKVGSFHVRGFSNEKPFENQWPFIIYVSHKLYLFLDKLGPICSRIDTTHLNNWFHFLTKVRFWTSVCCCSYLLSFNFVSVIMTKNGTMYFYTNVGSLGFKFRGVVWDLFPNVIPNQPFDI